MQTFQQLFNTLLRDIRVELSEEFDRNFERKAFFNTAWPKAKHNTIGSLMNRTGALRSSIAHPKMQGSSIRWESDLPYAGIHNEGGRIRVTEKMKKFFWYRFRVATGGNSRNLNPEALFWRAMACKPTGSMVEIPRRQFIGNHPEVERMIGKVAADWLNKDVKAFIDESLKNKRS